MYVDEIFLLSVRKKEIRFHLALKRKLQTRRSRKELVDAGIMPSSKASLPFFEQRKQLDMRKVGSFLFFIFFKKTQTNFLFSETRYVKI